MHMNTYSMWKVAYHATHWRINKIVRAVSWLWGQTLSLSYLQWPEHLQNLTVSTSIRRELSQGMPSRMGTWEDNHEVCRSSSPDIIFRNRLFFFFPLHFSSLSAQKITSFFHQITVDLIELLMLTSFSILCAIHFRMTLFCSWQMENPVVEYFWMLSQDFFSPFLVPLLSYLSSKLKQALHRFGGFLISQRVWKIRATQGIQSIWNEVMYSTIKMWKPMLSNASTLIWFNKSPVLSVFQLFPQTHFWRFIFAGVTMALTSSFCTTIQLLISCKGTYL